MDYYFFNVISYALGIAAMLLALYAQAKVRRVYNENNITPCKNNITGEEAARRIMERFGLQNIPVEMILGKLTDHYDPSSETLYLSEEVYKGRTLSAIGVAAHETGHALQHAEGFAPLGARLRFFPVVSFGSRLAIPLVFIGLFITSISETGMLGSVVINVGILLYALVVMFYLITLPVEFNASSRAVLLLETTGILEPGETEPVKNVLNAAAWTYIASALSSVATLIRLLLVSQGSRKRR